MSDDFRVRAQRLSGEQHRGLVQIDTANLLGQGWTPACERSDLNLLMGNKQ